MTAPYEGVECQEVHAPEDMGLKEQKPPQTSLQSSQRSSRFHKPAPPRAALGIATIFGLNAVTDYAYVVVEVGSPAVILLDRGFALEQGPVCSRHPRFLRRETESFPT